MNLTFRGVTAKAGLLLAVLAAATALSAPIQPPRIYASGAGNAAVVDVTTMPSDPPIIRD